MSYSLCLKYLFMVLTFLVPQGQRPSLQPKSKPSVCSRVHIQKCCLVLPSKAISVCEGFFFETQKVETREREVNQIPILGRFPRNISNLGEIKTLG